MIRKILENIFVIGTGITSNSVLVCGKKSCVLFDTTLFVEKAEKIKKFAREAMGREIAAVFNTHYHPDHTFGNAAFERVIGHALTREKMKMMDQSYLNELGVGAKVHPPTETFKEEHVYEVDDIVVEAYHFGGHTPDSSVYLLRDSKVLICGDLLMNGVHAEVVHDSDLERWIEALDSAKKTNAEIFVPGHGEIAALDDLERMKEYLMKLMRLRRGEISPQQILEDENFSKRKYPELFGWSVRNVFFTVP